MEPYTAEGMAWREQLSQSSSHDTDSGSQTFAAGDTMSDDSSMADFSASVSSSTAKLSETSGQLDVPKGSASSLYITAPVNASRIDYELVGVVVHSGQANAGHYYSFIKDRRFEMLSFVTVICVTFNSLYACARAHTRTDCYINS